ncbi:MAG TPA: hypothetical protein VGH28_24270 [Polyangiaceae bacterium]|jgi:hypothetical protein
MRPVQAIASLASGAVLILACAGAGTAAPYAMCSAGESCSGGTVCETAGNPPIGPFCTHSCDDSTDCPASGACASLGGTTSFCYQTCPQGTGCPAGELCENYETGYGETTMICLPTAGNVLSGTSWTTTDISTTAKSDGVVMSSYTINFDAGDVALGGAGAAGAFSAVLTQTYSTSPMFDLAGCTETTRFDGGTWGDTMNPDNPSNGAVAVTGAHGVTTRSGCVVAANDTTDAEQIYDAAVDGASTGFVVVDGTTLEMNGATSVVPYDDGSRWSFRSAD